MRSTVLLPMLALLFHHVSTSPTSHVHDHLEPPPASPFIELQEPLAASRVLEEAPQSGCTNEQVLEKMLETETLVTAIKMYVERHGLDQAMKLLNPALGHPSKTTSYRGRNLDDENNSDPMSGEESSESIGTTTSGNSFGETFKGTIDVGVNLPVSQVISPSPSLVMDQLKFHHHSIGESLPSRGGFTPIGPRPGIRPGTERVLLIPGWRLRPFSPKVRITANGKTRELKITVAPRTTILAALRQAEKEIHLNYPELTSRKVIDIGSVESSSSSNCFTVTKVGNVEADESHVWQVKLTTRTGDVKFDGTCLPSVGYDDVYVKPGSTIDLMYQEV